MKKKKKTLPQDNAYPFGGLLITIDGISQISSRWDFHIGVLGHTPSSSPLISYGTLPNLK